MASEVLNWSRSCIYRIALSPGKSELDRGIPDQLHPGSMIKPLTFLSSITYHHLHSGMYLLYILLNRTPLEPTFSVVVSNERCKKKSNNRKNPIFDQKQILMLNNVYFCIRIIKYQHLPCGQK